MRWHNPFAFRPAQVTFWTTVTYLALLVPLIYIHENVPRAPSDAAVPSGLSLYEAWNDLANITRTFHPFNSHANDDVRNWLMLRIEQILEENGAAWSVDREYSTPSESLTPTKSGDEVVVFNDMLSNVTFRGGLNPAGVGTHFQGSNLYVYIRGREDEQGEWWKTRVKSMRKRLVLVNAHFDSVPSAYGATDDGVGVITVLQLIKYFTRSGHQPRRGIVALLNNAEEDGLLGAVAFGNSPFTSSIGTFLNLEGAGAGGRATLFRTTDLEVTSAYRGSPEPFGSVIGTDGFKMRWIMSETDFRVWVNNLGFRGLDIAFYTPRARYHTPQDDRRRTSKDSVWHMLSSSWTTTNNLAGDLGDNIDNAATDGVWFDLFGSSLVLFALRGMFAWSLTILVAAPLILIFVTYLTVKTDKDFIFKTTVKAGQDPDSEKVSVGGFKGLFRFPFALVVAGALVFGAALLLRKVQPFIIYSSPYAVWAMMIALFYFVFWTIMRGANFVRPSAFHRAYVHIWLFVMAWAILVAITVFEDRMQIASGYIFVFWASQVFLATLIAVCEFFALPRKKEFAQGHQGEQEVQDHLRSVPHSDAIIAPDPGEIEGESAVHDDDSIDADPATETSPLMGGDTRGNTRTTFATGYRRSIAALLKTDDTDPSHGGPKPYDQEQAWSGHLPTWTWFLQFLLLGPFMIVLTAQLGLTLTSSLYQTGADGSDTLRPYFLIAAFTILLLLPITPFIHRVTQHIPLFFLAIFIGTLVYNLLAFPFSPTSPYKIYFRQDISLDTGNTTVLYTGYETYVRAVLADIPSAQAKPITCSPTPSRVPGLVDCAYDGAAVPPNPGLNAGPGIPPQKGYKDLVLVNATRFGDANKATLRIKATNTKTCALRFRRPVRNVHVHGSLGWDERFEDGEGGKDGKIGELALWSRGWDGGWAVDVEWDDDEGEKKGGMAVAQAGWEGPEELKKRTIGLDGEVVCRWSDANTPGVVPAVDEAWQYAPGWVLVSIKARPGLVEGRKSFMV